ncbi:MAG TPA: hypothetical protein VGL75_05340 [Acidothermaceae bacterium]|jgi:hypothetical protein
MNDEDFARQAFAAAFRSGQTGEPPTLPDVEMLARHGRRANRTRHGLYAAGSTVLAGAAVTGVIAGPTLLGLGNPSSSDISAGSAPGAGATTSPPPSAMPSPGNPLKPVAGVPCSTTLAINWLAVVAAALPTGVTATTDQSADCVQTSDGSRTVEALFKLSTGDVTLQVNVMTGANIAAKLGAAAGAIGSAPTTEPGPKSLDPSTLDALQASKMAAAASAAGYNSAAAVGASPPSAPPSLDAAAISSLEARKLAIASARATASPAPGADANGGDTTGAGGGDCSNVSADESVCISHGTKGSTSVVEAQILRTGSSPVVVDVMASNGKDDAATPGPGQLPTAATMQAIAQAVAAHF